MSHELDNSLRNAQSLVDAMRVRNQITTLKSIVISGGRLTPAQVKELADLKEQLAAAGQSK